MNPYVEIIKTIREQQRDKTEIFHGILNVDPFSVNILEQKIDKVILPCGLSGEYLESLVTEQNCIFYMSGDCAIILNIWEMEHGA